MATEPGRPDSAFEPHEPAAPQTRAEAEDHDQRLKELIQIGFVDFMNWVRPGWIAHFRFDRVEWLKQEVFVDPPTGDRLLIDLVAKVPAIVPLKHPRRPGRKARHALFHIEIENSRSMTRFEPRVISYNIDLERRHDLPVFSQALLLRLGLSGLGRSEYVTEYFGEETRRSGWRFVGLPSLNGLEYIEGDNILATALSPLMRIPKAERMWACAQALEKISHYPGSPHKRFLLGECVQAYAKLNRSRWERFMASLTSPDLYSGANRMVSAIYREGEEKGRRSMFLDMLKSRFAGVDADIERQVRSLSDGDLKKLMPILFTAQSLNEIEFPKPEAKNPPRGANGNGNGR